MCACWPVATRPGARRACPWWRRRTRRADADCIDFLFFTHGRHEGNAEAAAPYLAWEIGLVDQLDAQERGSFACVAGVAFPEARTLGLSASCKGRRRPRLCAL